MDAPSVHTKFPAEPRLEAGVRMRERWGGEEKRVFQAKVSGKHRSSGRSRQDVPGHAEWTEGQLSPGRACGLILAVVRFWLF